MAIPSFDFIVDAHWVTGSEGSGDVAGKLFVGHVGIVFERAGWLDDVDPPSILMAGKGGGEFCAPMRLVLVATRSRRGWRCGLLGSWSDGL
jgi:hypothetical protein